MYARSLQIIHQVNSKEEKPDEVCRKQTYYRLECVLYKDSSAIYMYNLQVQD